MTRPLRRAAVCVGSVPRIDGKRVALQIGAVPVLGAAGFLHQRGETLLGARIRADIEFVEIQHGADAFDGLFGDGIACTGKLTQGSRCDEADEQAQDGDDDEDLQQGEAFAARGRLGRGCETAWRPRIVSTPSASGHANAWS